MRPYARQIAPALAIYFVLAILIAYTKAPWCDEGWFANPAFNLAFKGYMGTNVLEPSGHVLNAYLSGIQQRTYVVTPFHLVALAAWFRVVGFSIFKMRLYSVLWGAVALTAASLIARKLFPDKRVAQLASVLTAIDFIFLWSTVDGRMEGSALALALSSIAAFLYLRERHFDRAVIVSQAFAALAIFVHPNAVIPEVALLVLILRLDRRHLHARHLAAAIPYLLFAAAWAVYILQSPSDFKSQFFANAAGPASARWQGIVMPWRAVSAEFFRYLSTYSLSTVWSGEMTPWTLCVPLLYAGALLWLIVNRRKLTSGARIFLLLITTVLLGQTFFNGFKASMYLVYVVPFLNIVLASCLLSLWRRGNDAGAAACVIGLLFAAPQGAAVVQHIRADELHREFGPMIQEVRRDRAEGKSIIGPTALGFGLGFSGFHDDWRLGRYSGLHPDLIVLDRAYRDFMKAYEKNEPGAVAYDLRLLTVDYQLEKRYGSFWLFSRRQNHGQEVAQSLCPARGKQDRRAACVLDFLFSNTSRRDLP